MPEQPWQVAVGDVTTSVIYEPATANEIEGAVFVCAHGAGGNMNDRGLVQLSRTLRDCGLGVARFNFLYRERKSGRPDPMPRLEETFAAVVEKVRAELAPRELFIGGRSMGGRASTMMAAKGYSCDGLMLFAYPLHPPGQPEKLRDAHLSAIEVPVLCFNGTRDTFCTPELMDAAVRKVGDRWTMHWLEGADHSFHVLKSSGRSDADVLNEVGRATDTWVAQMARM